MSESFEPSVVGIWPVPKAWCWVALGSVANIVGGGTPSTSQESYWRDGDVPWITPADLSGKTEKTIARGARSITKAGLANSGATMLPTGAVLMSSRAPVGYVAIAAKPLATNQGFKSFVLPEGILPGYLYWYLRANIDLVRSLASGTTFPEVSAKRAAQIPLVLAPFAEQRRIVAALEEHLSDLDAAVAGLERARANVRRYRAAVLRAAADGSLLSTGESNGICVGPEPWSPRVPRRWSWATVDQLAQIVEYGTSSKTQESADGIPVLRMGNIVDGRICWDRLKYLPATHGEFPRLLLRPGDVLFNRTNSPELVGKSAMYRAIDPVASFASYLLRVRLKPEMLPEFFVTFVNSVFGRAWVASVVSQQVGQANVNSSKLRALQVPVPPLDEQRVIVAEVEHRLAISDRTAAEIDAQIARAARLRQAILRRAFEGKLVPQDPADEPASVLLDRIRRERDSAPHKRTGPRGRHSRAG
jgi:type I restriction enzyme S subunit